jgi:hypothetical protein
VEARLSESKTLSEQLADQVAQKLVDAGLLRPERQQAVAIQIGNGKMKPDTWKLDIELALEKKPKQ